MQTSGVQISDGTNTITVSPKSHRELFGDWTIEGASAEPAAEPPKTGKGSGVDAWAAYAETVGVSIPDDATREHIIELTAQEG